MKISQLSASEKGKLVTRSGYMFMWADQHTIAVKHSSGWEIFVINDIGHAFSQIRGERTKTCDLVMPPQNIDKVCVLNVGDLGLDGISCTPCWESTFGRLAKIRIDFRNVLVGDGLNPGDEPPTFVLTKESKKG